MLFFAGTGRLNEYVETARPQSGKRIRQWIRLKQEAKQNFRECIAALEETAVDTRFLEIESAVTARRAAETPEAKAAAALKQESDVGDSIDPSEARSEAPEASRRQRDEI